MVFMNWDPAILTALIGWFSIFWVISLIRPLEAITDKLLCQIFISPIDVC